MAEPDTPVPDPAPSPSSGPWYHQGIRFACRSCGSCCRGEPGVVWVAPDEVELMSRHLGISRKDFRARYLRRIGFRVSLVERPDGDCILYHNGCSVYPVRPRQCRTFPFWPDAMRSPEWFKRALRDCPGAGSGKLYSRSEIESIIREGRATEPPDAHK